MQIQYMISFHHYFKELGILESLTIFSSKLLLTIHNVPLPLRTKVFQEIKRMEEIGIIQKLIYLHNGVLEWWWFP